MTARSEVPHSKPGRPADDALRARIAEVHRAHPELRTHQEIADLAGCDRRSVAKVLPPIERARGTRMVIPAELVAKAERMTKARGMDAVIAVLERALKDGGR